MFAKGRLPKDEPDLNQKLHALLDGWRDDLVSEHPTVSFAGARVVPDHALARTDLLIEAKYVRGGTTPSKASEGIAADLTKYPQRKHTLFIVYDPHTAILDPHEFQHDFESRGKCIVYVIKWQSTRIWTNEVLKCIRGLPLFFLSGGLYIRQCA